MNTQFLRRLLCAAAIAFIGVFPRDARAAQAQATDSLQLAGVAFLAADAASDSLFPIAKAVMATATANGTTLNQALISAFRAAGLPVKADDVAVRAGKALAFAFEDEYQVLEQFGKQYRIGTVITAQLLTIDFRTQQIVSAMPVTLDYLSFPEGEPTVKDQEAMIAGVTAQFLDQSEKGVFVNAANVFRNLIPASEGGCLVRLGAVTFDQTIRDATAARFGADTARLKRVLTSNFARTWMTTARQPLLPNENSQARNTMQGRFSNGEVFNLRIPKPDYEMEVQNLTTKRAVVGSNNVVRVEGTALRFRLLVTDTELRQPVTSGTFQAIKLDTMSVASPSTDGWTSVSNAVKSLMASVGRAAEQGDRKWLEVNDAEKKSFPSLPTWIRRRCGN